MKPSNMAIEGNSKALPDWLEFGMEALSNGYVIPPLSIQGPQDPSGAPMFWEWRDISGSAWWFVPLAGTSTEGMNAVRVLLPTLRVRRAPAAQDWTNSQDGELCLVTETNRTTWLVMRLGRWLPLTSLSKMHGTPPDGLLRHWRDDWLRWTSRLKLESIPFSLSQGMLVNSEGQLLPLELIAKANQSTPSSSMQAAGPTSSNFTGKPIAAVSEARTPRIRSRPALGSAALGMACLVGFAFYCWPTDEETNTLQVPSDSTSDLETALAPQATVNDSQARDDPAEALELTTLGGHDTGLSETVAGRTEDQLMAWIKNSATNSSDALELPKISNWLEKTDPDQVVNAIVSATGDARVLDKQTAEDAVFVEQPDTSADEAPSPLRNIQYTLRLTQSFGKHRLAFRNRVLARSGACRVRIDLPEGWTSEPSGAVLLVGKTEHSVSLLRSTPQSLGTLELHFQSEPGRPWDWSSQVLIVDSDRQLRWPIGPGQATRVRKYLQAVASMQQQRRSHLDTLRDESSVSHVKRELGESIRRIDRLLPQLDRTIQWWTNVEPWVEQFFSDHQIRLDLAVDQNSLPDSDESP